ncbi:helix-turn-helix domain-containing protein (plasmid) [Coraliomargarita sp. W4R53]
MVTVLQLQSDDPAHTLLTPQELAEQLRVPLSRLSTWRRNGGGPKFLKFGRDVYYTLSDIQRWVDESTCDSTGDRLARRTRRAR